MTGDVLDAELKKHGYRSTNPRRRVWEALHRGDDHLTAEEIAARIRVVDPAVNLASIYRALTLFAELGLVRESRIAGGDAVRWEPAHPDDVYHLVCRVCGLVEHHSDDVVADVRRHLGADHGFVAEAVELNITGVCARCRPGGVSDS